jgi:hypothetical protein
MSSEGYAAPPGRYNSPLQIKRPIGAFFLKMNLLGWVLETAADYNGCLVRFKFSKKVRKMPLLSAGGCHTRPYHSAE